MSGTNCFSDAMFGTVPVSSAAQCNSSVYTWTCPNTRESSFSASTRVFSTDGNCYDTPLHASQGQSGSNCALSAVLSDPSRYGACSGLYSACARPPPRCQRTAETRTAEDDLRPCLSRLQDDLTSLALTGCVTPHRHLLLSRSHRVYVSRRQRVLLLCQRLQQLFRRQPSADPAQHKLHDRHINLHRNQLPVLLQCAQLQRRGAGHDVRLR